VLIGSVLNMEMPVVVGFANPVAVSVPMETKLLFPNALQHARSENNKHYRDAQLEPACESIRDFEFKKEDKATGPGK
jgi:hypothetical protein